jgi:hypothetical protein
MSEILYFNNNFKYKYLHDVESYLKRIDNLTLNCNILNILFKLNQISNEKQLNRIQYFHENLKKSFENEIGLIEENYSNGKKLKKITQRSNYLRFYDKEKSNK